MLAQTLGMGCKVSERRGPETVLVPPETELPEPEPEQGRGQSHERRMGRSPSSSCTHRRNRHSYYSTG